MIHDRLQYFWDDFWNDQKRDQIWTLGPRIYHQNLSKNTRKIWEHPWGILFRISQNLRIWNYKKWRSVHHMYSCLFFRCCGYITFILYLLRRWGTEDDNFSNNKIHNSLDVNSISIKKTWNGHLVICTKYVLGT